MAAVDFYGELDDSDGELGGLDGELSDSDGELDYFEPVCSLCDDGGTILCCEGICKRSFHATLASAADAGSGCISLGFSEEQVQNTAHFMCSNCQYGQHQCFSCGELGSSDIQNGAEVFQCAKATCGYFYHPRCVARQLDGKNKEAAIELEEDIHDGEPFTCPRHICSVCQHAEDATDPQLQMAVCRRCPKAYHKRCLPRNIPSDDDDAIMAVDDFHGKRTFIFCSDHEIVEHLGTPARDHLRFPGA